MEIVLETERLILREFTPDDAEHFYLLNSDVEVLKYTGDKPFRDVAEAELFLQNYNHYCTYGFGRWAVVNNSTGEFLGWCGLKHTPELNETDIGFRFFKKHWNKGYATEAAKAAITLGFEMYNLHKIVGRAMTANGASVQVLKKCGLDFERHLEFAGHPGAQFVIFKKS